ncbi:hypothetical protein NQ318_020400 [Aromia moschata]|uniref:PiggyBac transposable element-derived protein domain-containing protein n=1 Tax=Aromia moschata TaxID=1265417 RepID=A0AAV8Y3T0_9CUCU|nr:hypothetical protein NQ318_020400 [Aromia moschata]
MPATSDDPSSMNQYSYEKEQRLLQHLMETVDTDEEYLDADSDLDEEPNLEQGEEGQLNHEQDDSPSRESSEEDIATASRNSLTFVGKDKQTRWKKISPMPRTTKTRSENIVKVLPGPSRLTKNFKSPLEIWKFFFCDEIINIIVVYTNKMIETVQASFSRDRDANFTDSEEIYALLGLLYLAGKYRASHLNLDDLWKADGSGIEIFRLVMSLRRFRFLMRVIRFDDKTTRQDRVKIDKLAPIREIFDLFIEKCRQGYHHSEYVTIDEMLLGFRGHCSFRQYIPSKPNKYGIKSFSNV